MKAVTLDEFFLGYDASRRIFDAVLQAMEALGPTGLRAGRWITSWRAGLGFLLLRRQPG